MILNKQQDGEQTFQTSMKNGITIRPVRVTLVFVLGLLSLILSIGVSTAVGAADIQLYTVWEAIVSFNPELTSHQIIQELRIPRALTAALVGGFLALSGAIMQGLTRNALASPSIMGVTDGAAFAIVIALVFLSTSSHIGLMFSSFLGAGLGVILVFSIGALSKGGLTPVKLALAGVAVGALLSSISSAIAIHFQVAKDLSFWYAGGLSGARWVSVEILLPVGIVGIILALFIARSISILSLGEEVSKGLGQRTFVVKVIGVVVVLLLTGSAISVAGAVGFIGLVIPHITRFLIGSDYRFIIPCSAILGGLLLVLADIGARMVNAPFETPVGAITAAIGVPFFLYLARREGRGL